MTKTVKLISVAIIVLAILSGSLAWYGTTQRRAYLEQKGAAAVLTSQFHDYKAKTDPIIAGLQTEAAADRAAKLAAIEKANAATVAADQAAADLAAEKAKTSALPPDSLTDAINIRFGAGASCPAQGGLYIFTRTGAESVLNAILDREGYAKKYEAERSVSVNLRAALDAAERENGNLGQRLYLTTNRLDKAFKAWDADHAALTYLERSIFGTKVKAFIIGAGIGAAAAVIFNLVRGK